MVIEFIACIALMLVVTMVVAGISASLLTLADKLTRAFAGA